MLTKSLEGRSLDLLTITVNSEREKIEEKPVIFLSARVHPGEVCSSFVIHGIIKFLLDSSPYSRKLLKNYVFKIIPMLNPDGVARGHYRFDTRGMEPYGLTVHCVMIMCGQNKTYKFLLWVIK